MSKKLLVIFAGLMLVISFSGCIDEGGMDYSPEYSVGDSWTYEEDTEELSTLTMTIEIIDDDASYQGESAILLEMDIVMDDFENETIKMEGFSGSGEYYQTEASEYREMEMEGTFYLKEYDLSIDTTIIIESEIDITGDAPDTIEVGDEWTSTRTEETTTTYQYDEEWIDDETETEKEITTREYEVVEKIGRSVTAGTFETMKIEWIQVDGDEYGTIYYSEEVKNRVESIDYNDETTTTELISYDVE